VVSQFNLWVDCRKDRRPSFAHAARPETGKTLCAHFIHLLEAKGVHTETGRFQEIMDVLLINDGPVTLMMTAERHFKKVSTSLATMEGEDRDGIAV
jgi:D-tyrosyl-tRNA(Tyr) deacylase